MQPQEAGGDAGTLAPDPSLDAATADGGPGWPLLGGGALVVVALVVALVVGGRRTPSASPPPLEDRSALPTAELPTAEVPGTAELPVPVSLTDRLMSAMGRTREALGAQFDTLFGRDTVDEEMLEDLEEILLLADVGMPTTERLLEPLTARMKAGEDDPAVLREALRDEVRQLLTSVHTPFERGAEDPFVMLVVGVNGSGKTTSIGKLAHRFGQAGHKVMLAAGDTYRAAAAEQLEVWAERAGADIVRHDEGADPGAVVFDALDAAKARGCDTILVDTAGRLQTRRPLMEELSKVCRVIDKKVPGAPHATLLVVDGTQGQNAMSQARAFHDAAPLTHVVVTKLDGTAKGGMVLAIASEMKLPVAFIGIGEKMEDLRPFEVDAYVDALT